MTINDHDDLTDRLTALADGPAPPVAFDVATSISQGRARLRRRQRFTVGTVATVTALTIGATLLLEPSGSAAPASVTPPVVATSPSATAAPAGSATAVLTAEARFGWLPDWLDGERSVGYVRNEYRTGASASEPGVSGRRLDLTLLPAGPEPALVDSSQQKQEKDPAPAVNGGTAYWVVNPTHPTFDNAQRVLRWQTPSGRWATLVSNRPRGNAIPDDVLLRVAAGVEIGRWEVPLPFWLSGLPSGLRPDGASLVRPADPLPWAAGVGFTLEGKSVDVTVAPVGELRYGKPVSKCRTEQGLQICASTYVDGVPALDRFGGLEGLTRLVHPTGADPSTWTTDVIR
ncbi:hypothetical protein AB0C76_34085 [Kitasatospora sp. NPDC048722]|uniref:hypothetical protein n=1 Tax=Kitasatospora sp. NPDC048722 TaxID=3155639 RepID=UPI0033D6F455